MRWNVLFKYFSEATHPSDGLGYRDLQLQGDIIIQKATTKTVFSEIS